MKSISVRLPDESVQALQARAPGASLSESIRDVLATATVVAQVSNEAELPAELSEFKWQPLVDNAPLTLATSRLENTLAAAGSGIELAGPVPTGPFLSQQLLDSMSRDVRQVVRRKNALVAAVEGKNNQASFVTVDPTILASMQLSEFYMLSEGDIWQALVMVPLELGFHDYVFPTGDKGAIREVRQFFDDVLDMHTRLQETFIAQQMYGNAFPLDVREGKRLTGIVVPNSKHIAIVPQEALGSRPYFYAPPEEQMQAVLDLDTLPSFFYNASSWEWNEPQDTLMGIELDPKAVTHFYMPKAANNIYGLPPLQRAIRAIDSRRFLEEMTRATTEGLRNQFWLFKLEQPRKGEVAALTAQVAGSRGNRTGFLVWSANLDVEQFIPGSIDTLLGNDTYKRFTMDIYRRIGVSVRMVAGESPDDTSRGDSNVDVDVFLSRLRYTRLAYQRWLQRIANEVVGFKEGEPRVQVGLASVELQVERQIQKQLVPLMNFGLTSPRTAFTMAGLDPDREMEQHKADKTFRDEYLKPYTGFAQTGPTGTTQSEQGRRPAGGTEMKPRKPKESLQAMFASTVGDYSAEIEREWNQLVASLAPDDPEEERKRKVSSFIYYLLGLGDRYRRSAYAEGYSAAGGLTGIDEANLLASIAWDSANASAFEEALLAASDITGMRNRALMYAEQGWKMAYMAGMWQAKAEQGWTGWRRILRPSLSRSGPCAVCRADARNTHALSEPFFDHPSGVCGMAFVMFTHGGSGSVVMQIPVITETGDLIEPGEEMA